MSKLELYYALRKAGFTDDSASQLAQAKDRQDYDYKAALIRARSRR